MYRLIEAKRRRVLRDSDRGNISGFHAVKRVEQGVHVGDVDVVEGEAVVHAGRPATIPDGTTIRGIVDL